MILPDSQAASGEAGRTSSPGSCAPGRARPGQAAQQELGWTEPDGLVVGEVLVGQTTPQAADEMGQALFSETAHRFTVLIPAASLPDLNQRRLLIETLESEKPAHTDFHLCFVEARLSVGCQARLDIDAILAGPPDAMALGQAGLGRTSTLGAGEAPASRLGSNTASGGQLVIQ
jgi:hypothetical protein